MSAATAVVFLLISCYYYRFVLAGISHRIPPGQDGILYAWYLEWTKHSILHFQNPFLSAAMNAPVGFNVTWNTWLPLLGVLCLPLVLLVGPFTTVSVLIILGPAMSATSLYLVLRRVLGGWWGPAIAGLLYGFGPWSIGHADHLNLLMGPLAPIIGLLGYRLIVTREGHPRRLGVLAGLAIAAEFLIGEELLLLFAICAAGAVLSYALVRPRAVKLWVKRGLEGFSFALGVALCFCALPLYYQLFGANALTKGTPPGQGADLASFVRPGRLQYFSSAADRRAAILYAANSAESTSFLGWPLLLLTVVAVVWLMVRRDRFSGWWLLTVGGVAVLSLGAVIRYHGVPVPTFSRGLWALIRKIPLLDSAQTSRFSVYVAMLVGVLAAYVLAQLRGRGFAVAVVAVLLSLIPLAPPITGSAWEVAPTPKFFSSALARQIPEGADLLILPFPDVPEVRAMVWQIQTNLRFNIVGGYSVFDGGTGRGGYHGVHPQYAQVLIAVQRSGEQPSPTALEQARQVWQRGSVHAILFPVWLAHYRDVVTAATAITHCVPRTADAMTLCSSRS